MRTIRRVLGISKRTVRDERMTSASVRSRFFDTEPIEDTIRYRKLSFLGKFIRKPANKPPPKNTLLLASYLTSPRSTTVYFKYHFLLRDCTHVPTPSK